MKKVAVISGGASGIGLATAEKFLLEGYEVFSLDLQASNNEKIHSLICDFRDIQAIQQAVVSIAKTTQQQIDVLVHSAGVHLSANIEATTEEDFFNVLQTNFTGCFFLLKSVLPLMRARQQGAVVLVGSDQSIVGKPSSAIYGATKAAIAQLAKSTALDYAQHGIKVNCVCPGTIDTHLYRKAISAYSDRSGISLELIEKEEAACQPVNRVGLAEEVAETIFFAASENVGFMTGSLLVVDGGYTAK
jgi:NAD(P)-dependent dehydrogenase (short-subunit alcohol dehydrogenase family)